jgi:anti-sigma B factor antagonist
MTKTIRSRLLVENVQGVLVVTFADQFLIEEGLIHEVGDDLVKLVDKHRRANVLLNFREVQAMSSTMLAVLLKVARRVGNTQGRLKLCSISPDLVEIFRITRFDRMFEIYAEEVDALDAF